MAKTDPVDPNVPAGGETPRLGDDRIRELARAVAELVGKDHYMGSDSGSGYTEDAAGEHAKITLNAPLGTDPTNVANKGFLYMKDVAGKVELFWEDEDGDVLQLTAGGVFNPVIACGLTGNQTIAGIKTFSSSPIVPAPTTDLQAATKKYIDDLVAASIAAIAQSRVKGWVNFDGDDGSIRGTGYNITSVVRNEVGNYTITWDTNFADTNYVIVGVCGDTAGQGTVTFISDAPVAVGSVIIRTSSITGGATDYNNVHIMAIGDQ